MEQTIQILIYLHATFGGVALVSGLISMIAKKGNQIHKKSGLWFYYSMLLSGGLALFVTFLPNHENPFLFAVGVFSLYFVISGYRALNFKQSQLNLTKDKWIALVLLITGVLMILLPVLILKKIDIVLAVFGTMSLYFSIKDLLLFKTPEKLRKSWLKLHLGKMIGGYISAATAFVVVNQFFTSLYSWFAPGIIGSSIIIYWMRKVSKVNS